MDLNVYSYSAGLRGRLKVFVVSVGFSATVLYRIQHSLYKKKLLIPAYAFHRLNLVLFGVDILPGAQIGGGFRMEHPVGVVIGAGAVIGEYCVIQQGVTVGARRIKENKGNQFPVIGSYVEIGTKASILGPISIGNNTIIGAHSLVLESFPENSLLVGTPAKCIK